MGERAPYSRIYWTVRNDPRLADIYSDDHHWAAWSRLLLTADMAWPAPADIPGSARRASVDALEAAGIIERRPGGLFVFHGLDTERGKRQEAARVSAGYRTHTDGSPNGIHPVAERLPSRAEPSKAENSRAEPSPYSPDGDDRDSLDVYHELTGYRPWGEWSGDELRGAIAEYGDPQVDAALRAEWAKEADRKTLFKRAVARLARDAERVSRKATAPKVKVQVDDAAYQAARKELMG